MAFEKYIKTGVLEKSAAIAHDRVIAFIKELDQTLEAEKNKQNNFFKGFDR